MAWVNFAQVKRNVDIRKVFAYYNLNEGMEDRGKSIKIFCPFHDYQSDEPTLSFTEQDDNTVFQCLSASCDASGNSVDFVQACEDLETFRDAAIFCQEHFLKSSEEPNGHQGTGKRLQLKNHQQQEHGAVAWAYGDEENGNEPLEWRHESLDFNHPYMVGKRGFRRETLEEFGVGYYGGKGMMRKRVIFPIHNIEGELVAYVGRWPGDPMPSGKRKYLLPKDFKRGSELYNLHRAIKEGTEVIVVEGYTDVLRLYEAGFRNAVSIMSGAITDTQVDLLVENFDRVVLLLDGDEQGKKATATIVEKLIRRAFVRIAELPNGLDPDHAGVEVLQAVLSSSEVQV